MYRKPCIVLQSIICLVVAMMLAGCSAVLKKPTLTEQQQKLNIESQGKESEETVSDQVERVAV